jgi:SAM-dependent methyltransferase
MSEISTAVRIPRFSEAFGVVLHCPHCRYPNTLELQNNAVTCSRCGIVFAANGGVIDFVAGRSNTALNLGEYDAQKAVSFEHSLRLFSSLKRIAAGAIPEDLGVILEIGAGTGLLTMGMLAQSHFDRAVITDISPSMLALCGSRLSGLEEEKRDRIALVTYSGQEDIFAEGKYDRCIANSVLHHILDYAGLLRSIRKALNNTGSAIFVEPGAVFHEAMTLALAETIVYLVAERRFCDELRILAAWVEQTRFRLRASPAELAQFEDKHNFRREDLMEKGMAAGFSKISIVPATYDPFGEHAALNYMHELGIPPTASAIVMPDYRRYAEYQFRNISQDDMSEMYMIVFYA